MFTQTLHSSDLKICVIGLGYVGLPLAVELSKKYPTVGFDISIDRIDELRRGHDRTKEINSEDLVKSSLYLTNLIMEIAKSTVFIVTVPTPINLNKQPDLHPISMASKTVGSVLKKGDVVIYESTVYPGCTEEVCVPILEKESGLVFNQDFFCGYSPERINPGDKEKTILKIRKVTSGSTPEAMRFVDALYASFVTAGTFPTSSIKVAEAAKVIENTQRDINIAFMNELAIIFQKMELDTEEILQAASTKWNFLPFKPGLVGGHCIGVDPYYLTYKAETLGYHPEVILSGRRINDNMGNYIAGRIIKLLLKKQKKTPTYSILVMGITFKENCPDIRNSKVIDVIHELKEYGCKVSVYDPVALPEEVMHEYNIKLISSVDLKNFSEYDAVVFAVAHDQFKELNLKSVSEDVVLFDIKSIFPKELTHGRL
jgi:UDP-N-acetyl-D-galactosamine dehydrogenase